jgi:hypothetical protein
MWRHIESGSTSCYWVPVSLSGLRGAYLIGAGLRGADLRMADVIGADFRVPTSGVLT